METVATIPAAPATTMNNQGVFTCRYASPLGTLIMAGTETALTALCFEGQRYLHSHIPSTTQEDSSLSVFPQTKQWLDTYFNRQEPSFTPPLSPQGSAFRLAVWRMLLEIPYGQTRTYKELAERLNQQRNNGTATSARAVGGAAGHNPISLIIPCHRLIGSQGSLTGYAGGLQRKQQLLEGEQNNLLIY